MVIQISMKYKAQMSAGPSNNYCKYLKPGFNKVTVKIAGLMIHHVLSKNILYQPSN